MFTEVAMVTGSCVLFIQMGLSEAIQEFLSIKLRIISCPKCLTMWACLLFLLLNGTPLLVSIATSFICSYCALWLSLLYDLGAELYNEIYAKVLQTNGTEAPGH